MRFAWVLVAMLLSAWPAGAQEVGACDWRASAWNLAEPWEENSRTFSNGAVRLAVLDTIEPGAVPFNLLVLSPPYDELGVRQCRIISFSDGIGFAGITFSRLSASYDPAIGLSFEVPVMIYLAEEEFANSALLRFSLNQATGEIGAAMVPGPE
ncbi:MAG TPA: hypothetical protein ENK41_03055 [Rhodobacteraceae bacterium]|nr:hypothetical protein [Paracoccaceae bacterium]